MNDFPIDIVIPYVNNQDPVWQKEYEKYKNIKSSSLHANSEVRYRDWGTLKYLLRSIETNIPWINKVFIIVCSESQIPEWLDTSNPKLEIVLHKDYIPEQFLPTFNANTIETFLHRIKNLSEHFIYGNDDFFFLKPLEREDFFKDGKMVMNLTKNVTKHGYLYEDQWDNCCRIGMREYGGYDSCYHYNTDHGFTPMRKSTLQHLFDMYGDELYKTMSPTRENKNVNQHLPHCYELSIHNLLPCKIKNRHIRVDVDDYFKSTRGLDTYAIEDVTVSNFNETKKKLLLFMDVMYPLRSSFEKEKVNQDKLISVIVPVYNVESYIENTLDSIKNQTYKNFECIIIDDGSSDRTGEIVKEYCKTDDRFKYYRQKNKGVGEARNVGLDKAKGEYITFSDGDDINEQHKLEVFVDFLNNNPDFDFCYGMMKKYLLNGEVKNWGIYIPDFISVEHPEIVIKGGDWLLNCYLVCVRKIIIDEYNIRFPNIINGEDALFNEIIMSKARKTVALNSYIYKYIERYGSLCSNARNKGISEKKSKDILNAEKKFIESFIKSDDILKKYIYEVEKKRVTFFNNYLYGDYKNLILQTIEKIESSFSSNSNKIITDGYNYYKKIYNINKSELERLLKNRKLKQIKIGNKIIYVKNE